MENHNYNDYEGMKWLAKQRHKELLNEYSMSQIWQYILLRYLPGRGLIRLGDLVLGKDRAPASETWRLNG
ncbi:hypothetical protein LM599_02240 [Candidatus Acetothermia bacterium]|jgi:hypothetical protein|nr:hypothetical protein [Candidatus Acetothermia bacterium]MCI2427679.1 hypothetical protein [Candidatus Acetothermia bacterium]MCI2428380.1 hypothetical protein [Candidatus Acetothermia bacterium]